MGCTSFNIDINFAFLIYYQLVKDCGSKVEKGKTGIDQLDLLKEAQDFIFEETIRRNFSKCPVDPNFYIFSDNMEDSTNSKALGARPATETKTQSRKDRFSDYISNLKGTADAYSDTEQASSNGESKLRNQPTESNDYKEVYFSCRNLLFEASAVIRDSSGTPIEIQSTQSLSQLFAMAIKHEGLVNEMVQKARAQDRRNKDRIKQFKSYHEENKKDQKEAEDATAAELKNAITPN